MGLGAGIFELQAAKNGFCAGIGGFLAGITAGLRPPSLGWSHPGGLLPRPDPGLEAVIRRQALFIS